jgi:hypothetical protein
LILIILIRGYCLSQEKIIYPTWSGVLINLIIDSTEKWRNHQYFDSWDSLKALYSWMPEECIVECKEEYNKVSNQLKIFGATLFPTYQQQSEYYSQKGSRYLYNELLEVFAIFRRSLQKHGYLGKDYGAKPKYELKGHLGEPTV